mgnify:CR=1 FL=1
MKLPSSFNKMSTLEMSLAILFILYIIIPINTPGSLEQIVNSPLFFILLFVVTIYLFANVHPVVGVLFIFVAYELIRRSSKIASPDVIVKHTPSEKVRDKEIETMNPAMKTTLEEQIIDELAPIGKSDTVPYIFSEFKPVAEEINNASLY